MHISFCYCALSSPNPSRHLTKVNFGDAAAASEDCEGGGVGGGGAADKKISAEELFESVCSLKAAQTQMQLHDGKEDAMRMRHRSKSISISLPINFVPQLLKVPLECWAEPIYKATLGRTTANIQTRQNNTPVATN